MCSVYPYFNCVQCAGYSTINRSVGGNNNMESRAKRYIFFSRNVPLLAPRASPHSRRTSELRRISRQISSHTHTHTEAPNEAATKQKKTAHIPLYWNSLYQLPSAYSRNV